jgi:hypothetical protein
MFNRFKHSMAVMYSTVFKHCLLNQTFGIGLNANWMPVNTSMHTDTPLLRNLPQASLMTDEQH